MHLRFLHCCVNDPRSDRSRVVCSEVSFETPLSFLTLCMSVHLGVRWPAGEGLAPGRNFDERTGAIRYNTSPRVQSELLLCWYFSPLPFFVILFHTLTREHFGAQSLIRKHVTYCTMAFFLGTIRIKKVLGLSFKADGLLLLFTV